MGSISERSMADERLLTRVRISRGFFLGKYEMTQGQWEAVMGSNPSEFHECGPDCPVDSVSWDDVQEFVGKMNAAVGEKRYRLPTEAEWEYAARAGTSEDTYAGT
ncbi:MAG: formylglycine-generating enzyme family protein [Bryobacterales bacterium]|nr:formylglycine-generating enzyme family protein [Bryobacterales bacterium]